jgi:methylase of polypeptide subunit release factors
MSVVYDEIIDFIASGTTPDGVIAFQPSEETKDHVADLLHREKTVGLLPDEAAELTHFLELEHVMRLAKARARKHLADGTA